jgi:hypothetical protein
MIRAARRRTVWAALFIGLCEMAPVSPAAAAEIGWRGIASFTLRGESDALDLNRFNYQDSPFDPARARLFFDGRVSEEISVFGQLLADDVSSRPVRLYGLYGVFSNFAPFDLHVELGKIPSPFGTFAPRAYETENPLAAAPLIYQYHTTLRPDQLPFSPEELVAQRGRGQYGVSYRTPGGGSTGAAGPRFGAPYLYEACWDFGVVALGTWKRFEYALGVTQGTLGVPLMSRDGNDGVQGVGRIGFVPGASFRVSGSAAAGPYLSRDVKAYLPPGDDLEDFLETAWAISVDWSWSHLQLYAEFFDVAFESPWIAEELGSTAWYVEGEYAVLPGAYVAARFDRMIFDEITARNTVTDQPERIGWDQDVQRIEAAAGYHLTKAVLLRLDVQLWDTDGESWRTTESLGALQTIIAF